MSKEQYRVINLYGENVKRLKVIDVTPAEDIVTLAGENGEGKTTVLDCIRFALGGKDAISEMPIRHGEEEARIILDLGSILVKRRFTQNGEYISVETPDGARFPEPQRKLNDLLGAISFDPLGFTRMKPADQYKTLRGLVELDVDIEALDAANKKDFEERTTVNRRAKELEAQVAALVIPEDTPDEPVDVSALTTELLGYKTALANYDDLCRSIAATTRLIGDIEEKIADLQEQLAASRERLTNQQTALEASHKKLPAAGRTEDISAQISTATATNAAVAKAAERMQKAEELDGYIKKSEAFTLAMDERAAQKQEAMERAKMPIQGLSFADGTVMYDGGQGPVPFDQASKAQKIRISTAIAMAMNPALRIVLIEDASLLDDTSMEIIKGMAKENGFQIWIEVIKSSDPLAIHIVDGTHEGAVKREGKPKKAAAKAQKEAA